MSFLLGSRAHLVIASDVDEREKDKLGTDLRAILQSVIGGRQTSTYIPEIDMLAALLFYSFSLAHSSKMASTPGQDYANLSLIHHIESNQYTRPNVSFRVKLTFLAALLPYLYARSPKILQLLREEIRNLTEEESDLQSPPDLNIVDSMTMNGVGRNVATELQNLEFVRNHENSRNLIRNPNRNGEIQERGILAWFWQGLNSAVDSTCTHMGVSPGTLSRVRSFLGYLDSVHRVTFHRLGTENGNANDLATATTNTNSGYRAKFIEMMANGKYLDWAFRLAAAQLMVRNAYSQSSLPSKPIRRLRSARFPNEAIAWLVGARLVIQGVSIGWHLLKWVQNTPDIDNGSDCTGDDMPKEGPDAETKTESDNTRKCSLCLAAMHTPAVTPCGHVFCWKCIITWAKQSAGRGSHSQNNPSKLCPACRAPLLPQRIRALHMWN